VSGGYSIAPRVWAFASAAVEQPRPARPIRVDERRATSERERTAEVGGARVAIAERVNIDDEQALRDSEPYRNTRGWFVVVKR
jgi:hypothetical protein